MIGFKDFLVTNPGMEKDDHIAYMRAKRRKSQDYGNDNASVDYNEKAVSQAQQKLFGLALAVKNGEVDPSEVSQQVRDMAKDISKKDLEDFAKTKHKGLPKKVESTASWAKSLETIAKKRQLDKISPKDKETLKKIMALLNKEKK